MASQYEKVSKMVFTLPQDEQIKLAKTIRQKAGEEFKQAVQDAGKYLQTAGVNEQQALDEISRLRSEG